MAIDPKLIDKLLAEHGHRPQDIAGENGLLKQLTKALLDRAMQAEMTEHLGYEKHDPVGYKSGNSRNGKSRKKLKGDFGEIEVETLQGPKTHKIAPGTNSGELVRMTGEGLPSLTYLLTFPDLATRERNWNTFRGDPEWKKLSTTPGFTDPEIVSSISSVILAPAAYSQI